MHDPKTQVAEIKLPFGGTVIRDQNGKITWRSRPVICRIWHVDPCNKGHGDDSCGWFMRAHHGDQDTLKKIAGDILFDMKSEASPMFSKTGDPVLSSIGVTLNFFLHGAFRHFGNRDKAMRWMQRNLCELLIFAENPVDSMNSSIQGRYGEDREPMEERARRFAAVVYGWILRETRPWYKHPRWHIWHWELQFPWWQQLCRWLFSRCKDCGRRFRYGESVSARNWDSDRPGWFKPERDKTCSDCSGCATSRAKQ